MKKFVLMMAVVTILALPSMAWSQQNHTAPTGAGAGQGASAQGGQQGNGESFQDRKTRILSRLNERITCVQAASNPDALRACMPDNNGGGHGQGGQNGNGGNGGNGGKGGNSSK